VADAQADPGADALQALRLLAIDPLRLGGAHILTDRGPACDAWLQGLRQCLDPACAWRRLPARVEDEALLGGTDLTASLRAGRPIHRAGLLHSARGGLLVAGLVERMEPRVAAQIAAAMDEAGAERVALVALDSGREADESCPALLRERLALQVDLRLVPERTLAITDADRARVAQARDRLAHVKFSPEQLSTLCATAQAFGIDSSRAAWLALAVARASAALEGRTELAREDLEWAGRLVLAPRARVLPVPPEEAPPPPESEPQQPPDASQSCAGEEDRVVEATRAAIPPGLLATLTAEGARARRAKAGHAGGSVQSNRRGRPIGVCAGLPRHGARLDLLATLRTAAPWQRLRRAQRTAPAPGLVLVQGDDFRIRRLRERTQALTLFVLDASGSNALHRMAECKGAVELWLAECYVRRDQVAVVTFRGQGAELVVPPTRSLVRAKRSLAGLAGGGPTPLAHGLDLAGSVALQLRRRGLMPQLVVLTDGHANVARDGSFGRARAGEDAQAAARRLGAEGLKSLLVDTAPRPQAMARSLAAALQGRYLPLPYADARTLLAAVRQVA
jgi:magnesium chelatase subunit D